MEDRFERLAEQLLKANNHLSYGQARTWVESLWEDFESTRAKAGRTYKGQDMTEQIVLKWIEQYGPYLHQYKPFGHKFSFLSKDNHLKH